MPETVTIHIPTALRPQVGDREAVDVDAGNGTTVGQALGTLKQQYPEFGKKLYKSDGDTAGGEQLNRFINVYVNDEDARFLGGIETPLEDNDVVSFLPAVAGGAGPGHGRQRMVGS